MRENIKAREGFYFTNGTLTGSVISLGNGMKKEDFYEIPIAEGEKLIELNEKKALMKAKSEE